MFHWQVPGGATGYWFRRLHFRQKEAKLLFGGEIIVYLAKYELLKATMDEYYMEEDKL